MDLRTLLEHIAMNANELHDTAGDWLYDLDGQTTQLEPRRELLLGSLEEILADMATELWQLRLEMKGEGL